MGVRQLLISILVCTAVASCNNESAEYVKYTDSENGFEIDYPIDWDTTLSEKLSIFIAHDTATITEGFMAGFNIANPPLGNKQVPEIVDEMKKRVVFALGATRIENSSYTNDQDLDYEELEYNWIYKNELEIKTIQALFEDDDHVFLISFSYPLTEEQKYNSTYQHVINSFALL